MANLRAISVSARLGRVSLPKRVDKRMWSPKLKFQLVESQVKMYAEAIRQCQSYVTTSDICQVHDSKIRKHDKRDQGQKFIKSP